MKNKIIISEIIEDTLETKDVKTILFNHPDRIQPGQFYMVWIPSVDEIPMSVSIINKDVKGITFRVVGDATTALFQKSKHEKIGIRGPYGNGFSLTGDKQLFVAGGTGIAMIAPAVEQSLKNKKEVSVILGAKTKDELFFINRLKKTKADVHITTDDGSIGYKGFATLKAEELLASKQFDSVYSCGPELMMKTLYHICENNNIKYEASMERYMKCGVGLCGQCVVGKGLRVCVEGPVFPAEKLKEMKDFGQFIRDASGKKEFLK